MIAASLTPAPFSNLREFCALCVETHSQPRHAHAVPRQFTSLALVSRQILASPCPHRNPRLPRAARGNPFPLMALLHPSLHTRGWGVHRRRTSLAASQIAANSIRIRTSTKDTRNPFRISTSKTKDLKPFRMNTYRKKGRGALPAAVGFSAPGFSAPGLGYPAARHDSAQSRQELAYPPPSSSTLPVAQDWRSRLRQAQSP
jgi:hypothetical protein